MVMENQKALLAVVLLLLVLAVVVYYPWVVITAQIQTPSGVWPNFFAGMMSWPQGSWMMGMHGMMGWQQTRQAGDVHEIVEGYASSRGLGVYSIEEYSNNYYAILVDADGRPVLEVLVFSNGVVHPEPQSMMWNTRYGHQQTTGARGLSLEEARRVAEDWLRSNYPGSSIVEEYEFPGYYTFHFKTEEHGMQMLSVNQYTGDVVFHAWHGSYKGPVLSPEGDKHD